MPCRARENTPSVDDALVAFMRNGNRFDPSARLTGLDGLASWDASPLRIGR